MTDTVHGKEIAIPCILVSRDFPTDWLVQGSEEDEVWYAVPCVEGGWEQRKPIVMLDLYEADHVDSTVAATAMRYCQIPNDAIRKTRFLLLGDTGDTRET